MAVTALDVLFTADEKHMSSLRFVPHNPPLHPGRLMRDVLSQFSVPVSEATRRMEYSRASFYRVIQGKAAISAELALKFAQLTGGSANFYLRMQSEFDLWQTRSLLKDEVTKIQPLISRRLSS